MTVTFSGRCNSANLSIVSAQHQQKPARVELRTTHCRTPTAHITALYQTSADMQS